MLVKRDIDNGNRIMAKTDYKKWVCYHRSSAWICDLSNPEVYDDGDVIHMGKLRVGFVVCLIKKMGCL